MHLGNLFMNLQAATVQPCSAELGQEHSGGSVIIDLNTIHYIFDFANLIDQPQH